MMTSGMELLGARWRAVRAHPQLVRAAVPGGSSRLVRRPPYDRANRQEARLDPARATAPETTTLPIPAARVTPARFLGALALACALLFGLLVLFAVTGLGPLGVLPAIVVAMTFTARITKIRRTGILVALGLLSFLIVIVGSYAIAIAYILANPQTP
jgi:hypothetical protein